MYLLTSKLELAT